MRPHRVVSYAIYQGFGRMNARRRELDSTNSSLQPEVLSHSPLPVAGDTRVVIIHLLNKLWQILQLLAPFSGGVPTQRVQICSMPQYTSRSIQTASNRLTIVTPSNNRLTPLTLTSST
eukprot:scaffold1131_cov125-Skeletonema_dohrnii-CCMP3373.AAC.2